MRGRQATHPHVKTFELIEQYMAEHKYAPTIEELSVMAKTSASTINRHLLTLECEGLIRRANYEARAIVLTGLRADQVVRVSSSELFGRERAKQVTHRAFEKFTKTKKLTEAQLQANIEKVVRKAQEREAFRQDHDVIHDYRSRFSGYTLKAHKV